MALQLRPAKQSDAADMAILENIASHGLSLWLWQGAVKRGKAFDAYEWGRAMMADPTNEAGWSNGTIAEINGETAGFATGYLLTDFDPPKAMIEDKVTGPLMDLFAKSIGCWFVDSLATYSHHRRNGVARALMVDQIARARQSGVSQIRLVAEDGNSAGSALYQNLGFEEIETRPFTRFNSTSQSTVWRLMSRPVS
ncbi:MAG: GNAT family N-acetyltransferase [Pseudomonadota bacterium]